MERTADAMAAAGVEELVVVTTDDPVQEWAESPESPTDGVVGVEGLRRRARRGSERAVVVNAATLLGTADVEHLAGGGPAVATRQADDARRPPAYSVSTDAFESLQSAASLADVPLDEREWRTVDCERALDVRRPWEYLAANEAVLGEQSRSVLGTVHETAECRGAVVVESGAEVEAGSVVEGPAFLSSGCTVGPNAYVRGRTFIGPDAGVGHAVEIKNSVLLSGAQVPHLTYVGDSIVGPDANVGAGSLVANLRHDEDDVAVAHEGERVSTGRRKFGAVVGEDAKLGIGTRLNVGVTVGAGATTAPGEVLTRDRGVSRTETPEAD
ncbi:glucose-1-phosphate thymidylyltransferase [Halobacterium wangiae]|uniref:glucose-1-phosphate thymidylyltransferase n=1 Tax=Halobacterium wangiae TaxID=2902623 RepID=UPI001E3416E6|nr:glucose-1-phosphate thymidylyltransferase [Halobacterium wangiae]